MLGPAALHATPPLSRAGPKVGPTVARGWRRRQWRRNDLLALVRDNKLTMPPDQAMLLKVFVSLDGAFKKLDPGFDVMVAMQPTLHEAVIDQLSPLALGKRGLKVFTQYVELFADLPKEIGCGLYTAKTGNLRIRVELSDLHEIQRAGVRAGRLLAMASIT